MNAANKEISPPDGMFEWGYFKYDPQKKLIIRDDATVEILLSDRESIILGCLISHPMTRIPYDDVMPRLKFDGLYDKSNLQTNLNALRLKIGDVNFGRDPRNGIYGMWRYINQWADGPDGSRSKGNSGLILLNQTTADIQSIVENCPPSAYYRKKIFVA